MKFVVPCKGAYEFGVHPNVCNRDSDIVVFMRAKEETEMDNYPSIYECVHIPDLLRVLRWIESWYKEENE